MGRPFMATTRHLTLNTSYSEAKYKSKRFPLEIKNTQEKEKQTRFY